MSLDILIRGGTVIDGTGAAPRPADVAIQDGRIAAVERLNGAQAKAVYDVPGRYVVPGFIDTHVHGETALLQNGVHEPALRQGVTTYLLGQDGTSVAPGRRETLEYVRRYFAAINGDPRGLDWHWRSVAEYLERFEGTSTVNVAYLVPNANVRLERDGPRVAPRHRRGAAARCSGSSPRGSSRARSASRAAWTTCPADSPTPRSWRRSASRSPAPAGST